MCWLKMIDDAVAEIIVGVAVILVWPASCDRRRKSVMTEMLKDTATLMIRTAERSGPVLPGWWRHCLTASGAHRPVIRALINFIMAVQAFAIKNAEGLAELDINPVLVRPRGGVVAVDALCVTLIKLKETIS